MAGLSSLSIRRPVATTMVYLMLVVVGLVALRTLPVDLLPKIEFTELTVRVRYPNVGPEEIEQIITDPIENAVSGLPNLERITSQSEEGSSRIRLRFGRTADIDEAANDLRAALDRIRDDLPVEAETPQIFKLDLDMIEVVSLAATSRSAPISGVTGCAHPASRRSTSSGRCCAKTSPCRPAASRAVPTTCTSERWASTRRSRRLRGPSWRARAASRSGCATSPRFSTATRTSATWSR